MMFFKLLVSSYSINHRAVMKQLLEDYKRRLKSINGMIGNSIEFIRRPAVDQQRLENKASCYKDFISEMERALKNQE